MSTTEQVLHVPADVFSPNGQLGALGIEDCRIILADGRDNSLLAVSPGMARLGFAPISFSVPPQELELALGFLTTTLRLRVPGRDPADLAATIQSTSIRARLAGTALELSARFESHGPELIGEYYGRSPGDGDRWVQVLDIEADELTVTAAIPIESQGASVGFGPPAVRADFSLAVSARGLAALALDDTVVADQVKTAIERAVASALDLERYRAPLAAALSSWLRLGPFKDLPLRAIRPRPAADGGLELVAEIASP